MINPLLKSAIAYTSCIYARHAEQEIILFTSAVLNSLYTYALKNSKPGLKHYTASLKGRFTTNKNHLQISELVLN